MSDRFPELDNKVISDIQLGREVLRKHIGELYTKLANEASPLAHLVNSLQNDHSIESLSLLCKYIFVKIPMADENGILHPMTPTVNQIKAYLADQVVGIGDCKLLNILTAYITSAICEIPTIVSLRNYSGHPVLYVKLNDTGYKISYLHNGAKLSQIEDLSIFDQIESHRVLADIIEEDFPNSKSLLYWSVSDATLILDCINILRRSVANYPLNPELYKEVFNNAISILNDLNGYTDSIRFYWKMELDRAIEVSSDPRNSNKPSKEIKEIITSSFRFP